MSLTNKNAVKVVFLGESGTGKSSVITRYVHNTFTASPVSTIGASFLCVTVPAGDRKIELALWDTAGQEAYRGLTPMYYRNAIVAILVFDITSRDSFEAIPNWLDDLHSMCDERLIIILCGNKVDMMATREVTLEEAESLASSNKITYVETSAKTGEGISILIEIAVRKVMEQRPDAIEESEKDNQPSKLEEKSSKERKSSCC